MMKRLSAVFLTVLLAVACADSPSPEDLAGLAAKGYYTHLIRGEYDAFLAGKSEADVYPANYREQLLDNYRQFVTQQQEAHRGIREVRVVNAKTDTLQRHTNVFLMLCFGDSTNEEIVVPMVEHAGSWRMK